MNKFLKKLTTPPTPEWEKKKSSGGNKKKGNTNNKGGLICTNPECEIEVIYNKNSAYCYKCGCKLQKNGNGSSGGSGTTKKKKTTTTTTTVKNKEVNILPWLIFFGICLLIYLSSK